MVTNKHYYTVVIGAALFYLGTLAWILFYADVLVAAFGFWGAAIFVGILGYVTFHGVQLMLETVKPYERR